MFSFFKKKRNQESKKGKNSNEEDQQVKKLEIIKGSLEDEKRISFKSSSTSSSSNAQSPSVPQLSQNKPLLNTQQIQQPQQQKVFIEYTVQKQETLDDICQKFNMDKIFLMELNQIDINDEIPNILVVQATPIQKQIIMSHAMKDETMQQIEKNTNLLNDGISSSDSLKEMEEENKKIAFFASLEKNEEFPMKFITQNGIIKGTLSVNSFMVNFIPETMDFKRMQNEIELLKKQKDYKHHKFENNLLSDYSVTLDLNDIFMADINLREQQEIQYNLQNISNKKSKSATVSGNISSSDNTSSNTSQKKMEIELHLFISRASGINLENNNDKQFLKIEFVSTENFESNNPDDSEDIGRTYVHYLLQKLQYLIGKTRSHNEAIQQFTEDFQHQPSQSIVKHYQTLSCQSLQLMNLDADSLFSTNQTPPPKLEMYPTLRNGIANTVENPEFIGSSILTQNQFEQIVERLPGYLQLNDWTLAYSPIKHGFSYEQMLKKTQNIGPNVIIIRDRKHKYIFGAFVTEGWSKKPTSYGTGESFLFSFKKNPDSYQRKYQNVISYADKSGSAHIQHCNENGFAIGIDTKFALFIHHSFSKGTTHSTRLMSNDPLTESSDFKIQDFEIWGLDPNQVNSSPEKNYIF